MIKFIIDKILYIMGYTIIGIAGGIALKKSIMSVVLLEAGFILGMIYFGYILIPLDIVIGKKTECVRFLSLNHFCNDEVFKHTFYRELRFIKNDDTKLFLKVPESLEEEETEKVEYPPERIKLEVSYYRFSKILIGWKEVNGTREARYL